MTICYWTGSGNSLWVARTLAQELGGAELNSIADGKEQRAVDSEVIGLVFPVHIWGVPRLILEFVKELKDRQPAYVFAVAVNAGQVANTLVQLKQVLKKAGLKLSAGFEIPMPSNYIPGGGLDPKRNRVFGLPQPGKDIRNRPGHKGKGGKAGGKRTPLAEDIIYLPL